MDLGEAPLFFAKPEFSQPYDPQTARVLGWASEAFLYVIKIYFLYINQLFVLQQPYRKYLNKA